MRRCTLHARESCTVTRACVARHSMPPWDERSCCTAENRNDYEQIERMKMKKTATILILVLLAAFTLPAMAEDGAALFKAKCAACHGPDGAKLAKANLTTLAKTEEIGRASCRERV